MIGRTNAGGSGSGGTIKPENAIIVVTVPTGLTVTATKGSISLTPTMWVKALDNSQDCALFIVTSKDFDADNPWLITATNGTDTLSDMVLVTTNKEYDVELSYSFYLIRDGIPAVPLADLTAQVASITANSVTFARNAYNIVRSTNKINLTKYNSIFADMDVVSKNYAYPFNAVAANLTDQGNYISGSPSGAPDALAYGQNTSVPDSGYASVIADISSVNVAAYVGIAVYDVNAKVLNFVLRK